MRLLARSDVEQRLHSNGLDQIFIDPLLDRSQIGEVTVDLRLGYDFLVSVLTRKPFVSVDRSDHEFRSIESYFQSTRRELGEKFILYPNQTVITTSLEYVGLPNDVFADIFPRSSYARLSVQFNAMVQPGYRGCMPLEMANVGTNPVELVVGSRIAQCRLYEIEQPADYNNYPESRKYLGTTRPIVSRAPEDTDVAILAEVRRGRC
ncbi:dCTP deaminase [Rhodopila globiformis]|uniref:dCTP deaminase n=1 Tax=Rhodopila globiformis TaxID=1071 RepID=A0A2S6MTM9_RHOGL|nr:dCTP deaminase [Rhodopila globiformis]